MGRVEEALSDATNDEFSIVFRFCIDRLSRGLADELLDKVHNLEELTHVLCDRYIPERSYQDTQRRFSNFISRIAAIGR